jgi:hypothetical protein
MESQVDSNVPFRTIRRVREVTKEEPTNIVTILHVHAILVCFDKILVEEEPPNCVKELLFKVSE